MWKGEKTSPRENVGVACEKRQRIARRSCLCSSLLLGIERFRLFAGLGIKLSKMGPPGFGGDLKRASTIELCRKAEPTRMTVARRI